MAKYRSRVKRNNHVDWLCKYCCRMYPKFDCSPYATRVTPSAALILGGLARSHGLLQSPSEGGQGLC